MTTFSHFSAVIFDLDGLVLDTESTYITAWQEAAQTMGYDAAGLSLVALSGLHYHAVTEKLLAYFGTDFDLPCFNRLSGECWREHVQRHGIAKKSGFDALSTLLQQVKMPFCLATNSAEVNARECLEAAGLAQTFTWIISRDDVKQGKPAPDIFLQAARALQQPIQQCLVLEDSAIGIQAAQAAGAIPVLIPSLPSLTASAEFQNIPVFSDLHQVAEKILEALELTDL